MLNNRKLHYKKVEKKINKRKRDHYIINHTGSSLSAAAAFPTTAHIIPVLRNKNREYEIIRIDR